MTERYTHVTEYGRVGQVTLETRYRQLAGKVFQDGIRHTQVTFRIFKVNRVHLMRHRTGAYFTRFDFLLEVFHRDVLPEVTVHVNHNGIDALHGIEDGTQIIVIGNLSSILFAFQTELFSHELVAESLPIVCWISHVVRIVVTGSTTELRCNRASLQSSQLAVQTIYEHHHFLAQTSRGSWLTVSLCQHRDVGPFLSIRLQLSNQFFHQRIVHLFERFLNGKRNGCIVDVL